MRKSLSSRLLQYGIGLLIIATVFGGCQLFAPPSNQGSVVLRIAEGPLNARTILPDGAEITHYFVRGQTGTLPWRNFDRVPSNTPTLELTDLEIGLWRFQVFAENLDRVDILGGEVDVLVRANTTSRADVTLRPVSGVGTLIVQFLWPPLLLENPTFEATLSRYQDGAFGVPETLPPAEFELNDSSSEQYTLTYTDTERTSGYYLLETSISDESGRPGQEISFAVRVLSDLTTSALISLETGTGAVEITVTEDRQDPLSVVLTANSPDLLIGTADEIVITADVQGGTGTYGYRWSVNGELVEPAPDPPETLTLGPGLPAGRHRVSLVASDGIVLGSAWIGFDVVP